MPDQGWSLSLKKITPAWAWFDVARYGRYDAAAARARRRGPEAALQDYEERGAALGYSPNVYFDPEYYLRTNPAVAAAIAEGTFRSAFDHYRTVGWRNRDPHWLFDIARYGNTYPDLAPAAVDEWGGLYGHFLATGAHEGRSAHQFFDAGFYRSRLAPEAAEKASANPFGHYLEALDLLGTDPGATEPQASPYFEPSWYVATYQDTTRPVPDRRSQGALHHYLTWGAAEGRDPLCDFSETEYRQANPDVDAAIREGHFVNGYGHYLAFGASGARSPNNEVDLAWYAAQPAVAAALATGRYPHAFAHLLLVGIPEGLPLRPPIAPDFAPDEAAARAQFMAQARRALPGFGRHPLDFHCDGPPEISVIVVLRNQFALTMQALASLRHTFDGRIELLIVDNASKDETRAIDDVVHGARIMRQDTNLGFLRACNLALAVATAPTILYLNNDVVLHPGAVRRALDRLNAEPGIGAVGGKIVRTHGLLQEAGCILWRDGSGDGWQRGASPDAPEANYVRDVDFCSGCFLMVRGTLLRELGGFDEAFAPAYYEEVDLCLRIQAAGYRIVYDPAIVLTHYEYGSSRSARAASALMLTNRSTLRTRHGAALRARVADRRRRAEAAALASHGRRVLFIEDTVPLQRLGSGYGRASDAMCALVAAGWQATVFPMHPVRSPNWHITAALPETAEILWDKDLRSLDTFLDERRGYYDLVWVSRAHNLRQLLDIINRSGVGIKGARLVLDTEAVFSLRDETRAMLDGLPFSRASALAQEFEGAWLCDHVVAVNEDEAAVLRKLPLDSVSVLGFDVPARPTPKPWGERHGLLHVGALTNAESPNCDGLRWFLEAVHPVLEASIGKEAARLTVIGHVMDGVDLTWLREHPAVDFKGPVTDVTPYYASHRVFVAPTRFAAGVPTKVLDAAAHGLPVACTDLLARQLGWTGDTCVLAAPITDGPAFAANIARLVTERKIWTRMRTAALDALAADYSPAHFAKQLAAAVKAAGALAPGSRLHSAPTAARDRAPTQIEAHAA